MARQWVPSGRARGNGFRPRNPLPRPHASGTYCLTTARTWMVRQGAQRPAGAPPSHEVVDEALQLAEVAALEDAVAERRVLADDRVAGVPVAPGLRVQPVDVARPVLHLLDHPRLRRVVVVARV